MDARTMGAESPEMLAAMEASLLAAGDLHRVSARAFDRFFAAYPDERARFINVAAAQLRMTDEVLMMLYGMASGEGWALTSADHWIDHHRNFGTLTTDLYLCFTDAVLSELRKFDIIAHCVPQRSTA